MGFHFTWLFLSSSLLLSCHNILTMLLNAQWVVLNNSSSSSSITSSSFICAVAVIVIIIISKRIPSFTLSDDILSISGHIHTHFHTFKTIPYEAQNLTSENELRHLIYCCRPKMKRIALWSWLDSIQTQRILSSMDFVVVVVVVVFYFLFAHHKLSSNSVFIKSTNLYAT